MGKHQSLVIFLAIVGIASVCCQLQEDEQPAQRGEPLLDRQFSPETVVRRVARFTPSIHSDTAGASRRDQRLQGILQNLRQMEDPVPPRPQPSPGTQRRHEENIEQERVNRQREREQQQNAATRDNNRGNRRAY